MSAPPTLDLRHSSQYLKRHEALLYLIASKPSKVALGSSLLINFTFKSDVINKPQLSQKSLPEHNDLRQLGYDALRFAQYFSNTIEEHPLLIYMSALPLSAIHQPTTRASTGSSMREGLPKVIFWCAEVVACQRKLQLLRGHDYSVRSVEFSHDGSKIVSGSYNKTIRVWDANTGVEMLPPLRGHNDYVRSVAFSHDGSKIVSGSEDETIRVWDANTGVEMLPPMRGHDRNVTSVAFSYDGSKIVSGSRGQDQLESGMQTPASRCFHLCEATIILLDPSNSRMMDPKSSRGLMTRPFESGMQTPGLRCFHLCEGHDRLCYICRILA